MSFNTDMYKFILTQSRRCFYVNQTKGKTKIDKEIKRKIKLLHVKLKKNKNKIMNSQDFYVEVSSPWTPEFV